MSDLKYHTDLSDMEDHVAHHCDQINALGAVVNLVKEASLFLRWVLEKNGMITEEVMDEYDEFRAKQIEELQQSAASAPVLPGNETVN